MQDVLRRSELDPRLLGTTLALASTWIALDVATGGLFLTARNLYNLAVQSSVVGVMACGMVLVIVARHIDLSVGSLLGLTGMFVAVLQVEVFPAAAWAWPLSAVLGIALGAGLGAVQGAWVARAGLPAFVVTLAGLMIFRGAAYLLTDGRTVTPLAPGFERLGGGVEGAIGAPASWALGALAAALLLARGLRARRERRRHGIPARPAWSEALHLTLAVCAPLAFVWVMNLHTLPRSDVARGLPVPVLVLVATAAGVHVLARSTRFGRHVFAIGGNRRAAARAGVDVARVTLGLFAAMGALAGVAGVLATARLGAGTSSLGTLAELAVIAAAVIGGTRLSGGAGSVPGAILGAVLMQSLENGMVLLGVSSAVRQVGIGAVLLLAVHADAVWQRRSGGPEEEAA